MVVNILDAGGYVLPPTVLVIGPIVACLDVAGRDPGTIPACSTCIALRQLWLSLLLLFWGVDDVFDAIGSRPLPVAAIWGGGGLWLGEPLVGE